MWLEDYQDKEFSYLAAIEKGRKLPDWVAEEPYLEPAEEWLLSAYFDLATCRGIDGSIPWRDMVEYADRAGLEPDVGRAFVQIMRQVDSDKLKRQREKNAGATSGMVDGLDARAENTLNLMAEGAKTQTATKEDMRAAARRRMKDGKGKR